MKQSEYRGRRKQLLSLMGKSAIAIIPTAATALRNNDVEHPFRPDSDFNYLTGFNEPESVAILVSGKKPNFFLFCRERDPNKERWNGIRAGLEGAEKRYGADRAYPINDLFDRLPEMLTGRNRIYYSVGTHPELDRKLPKALRKLINQGRSGVSAPGEIINLDSHLHQMRLIKSPAEIERMRRAAAISANAHCHLMRCCTPGITEYQLEGEFVYQCQKQGARRQAYPAIVAGGRNACILHYVENDQPLTKHSLVLIDAGAEYQGYAADITRTFPVGGRFSSAQRELYNLVLSAQLAAIDQIRPGKPWVAPHEAAVAVLTKGLVKQGLLKGSASRQIKRKGYKRFFMHRTGHWLGMDVHDVGDYKRNGKWLAFEPGMVLTVEPGLYINHDDKTVDKRWRGIGIRIEDDVLVTPKGHEILTDAAPKDPDAIEAMMARL